MYKKETVYIGVVGSEEENGQCRDSILNIHKRVGDFGPFHGRGTKGFENRQVHIDKFKASEYDYILMLDADQLFQAETLEMLRSHKKQYVSGYYMRRRYNPIAPVWFRLANGQWPMEPWMDDPERGRLHELGASGWGCVLIHRSVFEATASVLKGESEVIEDDMDVWPYDLQAIMDAKRDMGDLLGDDKLTKANLKDAIRQHLNILNSEIRPLRGSKDNVGSDIRFPFYAREAGITLWGDPDVRPGHMLNYPLSPDDMAGQTQEQHIEKVKSIREKVEGARVEWGSLMKSLGGGKPKADAKHRGDVITENELQQVRDNLNHIIEARPEIWEGITDYFAGLEV